MFMSWASPRSMSGGFGLNKRTNTDHHHHKGSGFWSKLCYSCAIIILATILWVWAVVIHHIYNFRNVTFASKWFYIIGATIISVVIFVIIVYITMAFRPPRRHSTMSAQEVEEGFDGDYAHDNQTQHHESHTTKSADVVSPV